MQWDAYVIGALPPYNYLLGGKTDFLTSWHQEKFVISTKNKYKDQVTLTSKRRSSDLVLLVSQLAYMEKSSQYNRLKYEGNFALSNPSEKRKGMVLSI